MRCVGCRVVKCQCQSELAKSLVLYFVRPLKAPKEVDSFLVQMRRPDARRGRIDVVCLVEKVKRQHFHAKALVGQFSQTLDGTYEGTIVHGRPSHIKCVAKRSPY